MIFLCIIYMVQQGQCLAKKTLKLCKLNNNNNNSFVIIIIIIK